VPSLELAHVHQFGNFYLHTSPVYHIYVQVSVIFGGFRERARRAPVAQNLGYASAGAMAARLVMNYYS